jgi:hypothetical protein
MPFVPTLCVACYRVQLVSLASAASGLLECRVCSEDLRVVPGCSYAERDCQAFCDLGDIVAEASVWPVEARSLAEQVERSLWSGAYAHILERLAARMPGLLPLQVAVGRNSGAQRRLLALLKTIMEALATARRTSALYSTVTAPPRVGTNNG